MSSDGTHIDIVNRTTNQLDVFTDKADEYVESALGYLESLTTAAAQFADLTDITYSLDLSSWSSTHTPVVEPTAPNVDEQVPTVPTMDTIADVVAFNKGTAPTDLLPLTGKPGSVPASVLGTLPSLSGFSLPTFTSSVPADSVGKLTAAYSYTESTYTSLVKTEAQTQITSVLDGNLVVPTSVWDALWDRAAGDAAAVQTADEWQASNLAASLSMSGMASEALTDRLERAQERTIDVLSKTRLEQSVQESLQRREDLWEALKQAIAFEGLWLAHHEAQAGRSLQSAAKAHEAQVAAHNANVEWFNRVVLERVRQDIEGNRLELDVALGLLTELQARLQKSQTEIAQDDQNIKRWLADWQGYSIDKEAARLALAERVRSYSAKMAAEASRHAGDISKEQLSLSKGARDISLFSEQWKGVGTKASAISSLFGARIDNARMTIEDEQTRLRFQEMELRKSMEEAMRGALVEIEKAKVTVENSLGSLEHTATLSVGIAQGYLSGADVSFGSSASSDVRYTYSGDA